MATTDSERIVKLEVTQLYHTQRLGFLENQASHFNKALGSIQDNLKQIKWLALGGTVGFLLKDIGVIELIKGLL